VFKGTLQLKSDFSTLKKDRIEKERERETVSNRSLLCSFPLSLLYTSVRVVDKNNTLTYWSTMV